MPSSQPQQNSFVTDYPAPNPPTREPFVTPYPAPNPVTHPPFEYASPSYPQVNGICSLLRSTINTKFQRIQETTTNNRNTSHPISIQRIEFHLPVPTQALQTSTRSIRFSLKDLNDHITIQSKFNKTVPLCRVRTKDNMKTKPHKDD